MSSSDTSPVKSRFSASDLDFFSTSQFDPSFTADISNKMRVPKSIRVVGGHEMEGGGSSGSGTSGEGGGGGGGEVNGNWRRRDGDKVQMQVPDRIIVTGQESHRGAKALPRELQLETVVMPPEPEVIRIQTPPRSITLQNRNVGNGQHQKEQGKGGSNSSTSSYRSEDDEETLIVEKDAAGFGAGLVNGGVGGQVMSYRYGGIGISSGGGSVVGDSAIVRRGKRAVGAGNTSYAAGDVDENDEIDHLREQLSRMNRRLLAVEEDSVERKERERYMFMAGILYVAYKTCAWLFKTGQHH